MKMTIGKKLILGFVGLASLVVVVGIYGLNASKQITASFEGGDDHFRSIVATAIELSSCAKRAESHLMLSVTLHREADREEFYTQCEHLCEYIKTLDERVKTPEGRAILEDIKSERDKLRSAGNALLATHDENIASTGDFKPANHEGAVLVFHNTASAIRRYGVELANFETDFLNKQAAITAATEVNSYVKRAEGHLMLFVTLHDEIDREKFFMRHASLLEQVEILDERVKTPEGSAILDNIKSETDRFLTAGIALLEAYDEDMAGTGDFKPANHEGLVLAFCDAASVVRENGVELANFEIQLEAETKETAIQDATSIQQGILTVTLVVIITALCLAYFISRSIAKPVGELRDVAIEVGKGNLTKRAQVKTRDEIGELAGSFNQMTEEIQKRNAALKTEITERKQMEREIQQKNKQLETQNEELRAAEDELRRANEELQAANEELKETHEQLVRSEKLAAIGQLAGGVGHELRNPLGAIKNAAYYVRGKLLKDKLAQKEPRVMEFLDIMDEEIATSNKIINDLLNFARTGKPALSAASMESVIDSTLSRLTIPENISVTKKLAANLPQVEIDVDQMRQVMVNLITNAVQAMPEGGELTISALQKKKALEIMITDTGSGIPKEVIGKIFDPLFTTKAKGIGLGLAVCKSIIDNHQGSISASSQVGKGTTFTIKLPLDTTRTEGGQDDEE